MQIRTRGLKGSAESARPCTSLLVGFQGCGVNADGGVLEYWEGLTRRLEGIQKFASLKVEFVHGSGLGNLKCWQLDSGFLSGSQLGATPHCSEAA